MRRLGSLKVHWDKLGRTDFAPIQKFSLRLMARKEKNSKPLKYVSARIHFLH